MFSLNADQQSLRLALAHYSTLSRMWTDQRDSMRDRAVKTLDYNQKFKKMLGMKGFIKKK